MSPCPHPCPHPCLHKKSYVRGEPVPFSTCALRLPWPPETTTTTITVGGGFLASTRNSQQTPVSDHFIDFPGNQG